MFVIYFQINAVFEADQDNSEIPPVWAFFLAVTAAKQASLMLWKHTLG
jgi:hypothetical protein